VIDQVSTSDSKYTFTGLFSNTAYKFTITAVNAQGSSLNAKGKKSITVNVSTKTLKFGAVTKVKAFKAEPGFVGLSWTAPAKPAAGAEYVAYEIVWLSDKKDKVGTPIPIVAGSLIQVGNAWSAQFEYTAELQALGKKTLAVRAITDTGTHMLHSLDGKVTMDSKKLA